MAKKKKEREKRRRSDKETGRLLIKLGIIGYILVLYITCHLSQIDLSDVNNLIGNLFSHIGKNPFDIAPVNWEWLGLVSFFYFLAAAAIQVSYEKQKNTRPGEENGSAKWNDDFGEFAARYAEPFGKKEIEQDTGWLDKKSGLPWHKAKKRPKAEPQKTKSILVALFNKFKQKFGFAAIKARISGKIVALKASIRDAWLNFKAKNHKTEDGEEAQPWEGRPYAEPTAKERKRYERLCRLEKKLDVDLSDRKPKSCLEEKKWLEEQEKNRIAEEEKRRALDGERIYEMRKNRPSLIKRPTEKLSATLIPVNRNMILSQNVALSMDGRETRKNCNTLILGGSGAGKTRFYLKPNLMQLNCSYVITDPSGEILQTMGKFLEDAGYEIKVINLTNMDQSHCYNPFNYVREDADILVMIDVLTKNLTPPDSHSSDPFWPKSQAALLQAIAFYLYKECRPSERNFTNVMKLLRAAIIKDDGSDYKSPLDIIFEDLEKKDPNHIAVMQYSIFKQAPAKTASTILTCAQVDLAPFNLETIANLTGVDTIHMETIGLKPTALFCITPTAKTTYNWIISLAYTQLFETLYYTAETKCKGLRLPVHVRFLLDEFANIGQIPDFEQKLSTMRKYEISCAIIIQNMAQLETMYKESWKTIVGNCDEFIYLGGHESSSTEYVSKMLGKQTIKSRNSSRTYGRQGSNNVSLNATGRELMTPDEIAHMSDQDCLVMVKGVMPFFDKKYDLLKHPNYQYTGDADDELLFDIAAEIQTPQNNVFGTKKEERRRLEEQAKEDTRTSDRRAPMRRRKSSPLAVTPEGLVQDGLRSNVYNQSDDMYANLEVVGANAPEDEYGMPPEMEAESSAAFDGFVKNEAKPPVVSQEEVAPAEDVPSTSAPDGVVGELLSSSREAKFTNHLRALNDVEFVVLDAEFTGSERDDEIIELSVIDKNGVLLYSSLFRTQKVIGSEIAKAYDLDAETLENAPSFVDEWARIKDVLRDKKIIAFNADVDFRLLQQTLLRYGLDVKEADVVFDGHLDAMRIYLDIRPNGRNQISLQSCIDAMGMNAKETHKAAEDCRLTLEMLKCVDRMRTNAPSLHYLESRGLI